MHDGEASFQMYGQDELEPEVRDAALAAARSAFARAQVTASEAACAYHADLMLAEGLAEDERTDAHYQEHGASLKACEAYYDARAAAEAEVAKCVPANREFRVLFSFAG